MVISKKILQNIILILIIFSATIFVYWDLPKTFFQQDEWLVFGRMISYEATGGVEEVLKLPFLLGKGHFTPLSYYQMYLEFKLFGLAFERFVYVSIVTQVTNSLLLFYFVNLLLKNKFIAFFSALVFAVGVVSNQAVTWIAASPNTQGAVLFLLLALIFILKYLQDNKRRNYLIALIFFFIGLLFKETILFFFVLAPLMWVLFGQKKGKKNFYLFIKPLVFMGFIYCLFRAALFLIPSPIGLTRANTINLSFTEDIIRLILSPFRILPQAIIPQQYLIGFSDIALVHIYPQYGFPNPFISQTLVFGQVIPFLSIPIIIIGLIIYKLSLLKKETLIGKTVIFSLVFIMLSSLPFAFIPGDLADLPIYESRHLHSASIGASIFLVLVAYGAVKFFLKQNTYTYIVASIILVSLIFTHFYLTRVEVYKVLKMSSVVKHILNSIKMSYPKLPQKAIFLTESNTAYYGMPIEDKALPVQINFGVILLVWYYKTENFPPCLFDFDIQTFHMLSQRYEECDGRGFGYFRDYDKLVSTVKEKDLSSENVIGFSWNGKTGELKDTTRQVETKLKKNIHEAKR